MKRLIWMALPLVASLAIVGCSQESKDQYQDAGKDVGSAAQKTGDAISKDAASAKTAADSDLESSKVQSALSSAAGLTAKDIKVDTDVKAKTITLSGTVPDDKQQQQAETVAKGIAGTEFTVVNSLKVASPSTK